MKLTSYFFYQKILKCTFTVHDKSLTQYFNLFLGEGTVATYFYGNLHTTHGEGTNLKEQYKI